VALPDVSLLSELTHLDRSRLHLFVAGPGEGEGVAVALPHAGWILVDGCRTINRSPEKFPLEEIYLRFRSSPDDPVELMVLTHPHRDHTHGFAELLEELRPRRVGLLGTNNPLRTLAEEARIYRGARADDGERLSHGRAHAVLRAIEAAAERTKLLGLHDGIEALRTEDVVVHVRAPDRGIYEKFLTSKGFQELVGRCANHFSLVLEVEFGARSIVLGGDLVCTAGGQPVASGWGLVMQTHEHLVYHVGLKVPHHGSPEALDEHLMGPLESDRAWCVTPFNSSSLPRLDEGDGMTRALEAQSPIMLTALPVAADRQVENALGRLTRQEAQSLTKRCKAKLSTFSPDDTIFRSPRRFDPLDPVWCVAFDEHGDLRERWRGRVAVDLVR
jgi:hypothetical protein